MPATALSTILANAAARAAAPRATPRARTPGAGRKPSLAARFLADLATQVEAGTEYAGAPLVRAWAAEHAPAQPGRLTPHATIEAQLYVLAKAGALPEGWTLTSAKARAEAGYERDWTLRRG